jgi:hypothetical protein
VVSTILKNIKVNGKDDIPYIMRKKMFQTTNQYEKIKELILTEP